MSKRTFLHPLLHTSSFCLSSSSPSPFSPAVDFIADQSSVFRNRTMDGRVFVAHEGLSFFDPLMATVMYDLRQYESHPGNSPMFRWD